jgi:hypothetical protein
MRTVIAVAHNPQSALPLRAAQTVFVVERDESTRRSLEAAIGDSGWQETFASAEEFLAGACFSGPETMGTATKVWHRCRCAKADRGAP